MPVLSQLSGAAFSIWPFESADRPLVVEIYPRFLTGDVVKSDPAKRRAYLLREYSDLEPQWMEIAASSEDAFDAAVSALVMARHAEAFLQLPDAANQQQKLEGLIWHPRVVATQNLGSSQIAAQSSATAEEFARRRNSIEVQELACPFCHPLPDQLVAEDQYALAIRDRYPVTPNHTLVIPRRHVGSIFDLPPDELVSLWQLVANVRTQLHAQLRPDAFTIGINDGAAAGQTVDHAHVHVIPRTIGDILDPRGGIRWVIPEKAPYWSERT
jgi:diadenosine tetraphosphate (Ap4A) HIT family hydrolase